MFTDIELLMNEKDYFADIDRLMIENDYFRSIFIVLWLKMIISVDIHLLMIENYHFQ
jgi:hypothetical protein